jgi:hypothetical protein
MHENSNFASRERAERRKQVLASIGRLLRQVYDTPSPLPDRLADLMKELERSTGEPVRANLRRYPTSAV